MSFSYLAGCHIIYQLRKKVLGKLFILHSRHKYVPPVICLIDKVAAVAMLCNAMLCNTSKAMIVRIRRLISSSEGRTSSVARSVLVYVLSFILLILQKREMWKNHEMCFSSHLR